MWGAAAGSNRRARVGRRSGDGGRRDVVGGRSGEDMALVEGVVCGTVGVSFFQLLVNEPTT